MSDQKDEPPNSPTQDSTDIPLKKRDFAETMSSNSSCDDFMYPKNKKMKLDELQKQAYYDVLHAFNTESPAISSQRILIVQDLKKEWKITQRTHTEIDDKIKTDPLVKQLKNVLLGSDEKEKSKVTVAKERKITAVEGKPLTLRVKVSKEDILKFQEKLDIAPAKIQTGKSKPSSTPDDESLVASWGQVSPESLVGKWVTIRIPSEDTYASFLIKEYDTNTEMHYLVTAQSRKDLEDPCDWIDIRHIPAEDIIWQEGHPGFPTRKCFLKPGETILQATSTARKKKPIKEVGKTSNGIPIIRIIDKGKGIA